MAQTYMNRADYERLVLVGPPLQFEIHPFEERVKKAVAERYPCETGQVQLELRSRGLDADGQTLRYLIRNGKILGLSADGTHARWTQAQIDLAAEWFARADRFIPSAWACIVDNADYAQEYEARQEWTRRHGLAPFVKLVIPQPNGAPSIVVYRAPNEAEIELYKAPRAE